MRPLHKSILSERWSWFSGHYAAWLRSGVGFNQAADQMYKEMADHNPQAMGESKALLFTPDLQATSQIARLVA